MPLSTLLEHYINQLRDAYDARRQLVKVFPMMAAAANDERLGRAFREQAAKTRSHIKDLKQIFRSLKEKPPGQACTTIQGYVEEIESLIMMTGTDSRLPVDREEAVLDEALIAHARTIEYYVITTYITICTYAEMLNRLDDLALLRQTLMDEQDAHGALTCLPVGSVGHKTTMRMKKVQTPFVAASRVSTGSTPLRI